MAFLSPHELSTHLYDEQLGIISRDDDSVILNAIDAAIMEAKGYLSAYDTKQIFSAKGQARNALLLTLVKDIAVWHFIVLCNAGTDLEFRRDRYTRAVAWLRDVQQGVFIPDFPRPDTDGDGNPDAPVIYSSGSNPKRNNHF